MKKDFFAAISLALVLSLCGCVQAPAPNTAPSPTQVPAIEDASAAPSATPTAMPSATPTAAPNTITSVTLTGREELLASALLGNTFVFDYNVDETYKYVRLWMKAYTFGEETTGQYRDMLFETGPGGTMVFSLRDQYEDSPAQITFSAGTYSANSSSRKTENGDLPYIPNDGYSGTAYAVPSITLPASGETALAYARRYSGDTGDPVSGMFFKDYANNLDQIASDDLTYVFGCTFYTEKP